MAGTGERAPREGHAGGSEDVNRGAHGSIRYPGLGFSNLSAGALPRVDLARAYVEAQAQAQPSRGLRGAGLQFGQGERFCRELSLKVETMPSTSISTKARLV